jgi:site-specific DNA-cytosine methylase
VNFVGGVEYGPKIAAHASMALGHPVTCADVREVDYRQWRGVGYVHSSPPCTRASLANSKGGESALDMEMVEATLRAVAETGCWYFTAENVGQWQSFAAFRRLVVGLESLGFRVSWDVFDAADFGVPQHRKRLLLRAWRSNAPLPQILPTHGDPAKVATQNEADRLQGKLSLFDDRAPLLPWNGWYGAVEDLLPGCPDTELANWQVKRLTAQYGDEWLEKITESTLVNNGGYDGFVETVTSDQPAGTVSTKQSGSQRAVLVRMNGEAGELGGTPNSPGPTLTADGFGKIRAVLVDWLARSGGAPPTTTLDVSPSPTLMSHVGGGREIRAVLVNHDRTAAPIKQDSPSASLTASQGKHPMRAAIGPRVVKMLPRCLARLQDFPDSYPLPDSATLATHIIGNACPPLMMKNIGGFLQCK